MPRITELYAFVSHEPGDPDDEGLLGVHTGEGWMPLVCADLDRVRSLEGAAQHAANMTGRKVRLLRFTGFEVVKEISRG